MSHLPLKYMQVLQKCIFVRVADMPGNDSDIKKSNQNTKLKENSLRSVFTISKGRVGGGGGAWSRQLLLRSAVCFTGVRLRLRAKAKNMKYQPTFGSRAALRRQRLQDLSLFGRLPEGEPDWFPPSLLSFTVPAGSGVGSGTTPWGALSRTVKSAGGKSSSSVLL